MAPRARPGRPIGMSGPQRLFSSAPANRLRPGPGRLAASAALIAGAGLLLVVRSGSPGLSGPASSAPASGGRVAVPEAPAAAPGPQGDAMKQAHLTALPPPASPAIIYTASLTVRASDIRAAAARAAQLAGSAGGYVSSETARFDHRHPGDGTILIGLKIPAAGYRATLAALSTRLGTRISLSQRAQDVTQAVADVTSRVASAQ